MAFSPWLKWSITAVEYATCWQMSIAPIGGGGGSNQFLRVSGVPRGAGMGAGRRVTPDGENRLTTGLNHRIMGKLQTHLQICVSVDDGLRKEINDGKRDKVVQK